jgi:hypothetical protein
MELNRIPTLTEEQRYLARTNAQNELLRRLNTSEPQFSDYLERQEHKYSKGVERALLIGIAILLIAAFTLSAIHIFFSGKSAYSVGIKDETLIIIAGIASVFLSETMTVVFATAPAVLTASMSAKVRTICIVLAMLSVVFAVIGNVASAVLYQDLLSFNWLSEWLASFGLQPMVFLLSILPPITVLGASYVLESVVLQSNSRRFMASEEFNADMTEFANLRANIDQHEEWQSVYAVALWNVFVAASKRRTSYNTNTFSLSDKHRFVLREMSLDNWFAGTNFTGMDDVTPSDEGNTVTNMPRIDVSQRIQQYLLQYPEDEKLSTRQLAQKLGVSHTSINRAKLELSENGNGNHYD